MSEQRQMTVEEIVQALRDAEYVLVMEVKHVPDTAKGRLWLHCADACGQAAAILSAQHPPAGYVLVSRTVLEQALEELRHAPCRDSADHRFCSKCAAEKAIAQILDEQKGDEQR